MPSEEEIRRYQKEQPVSPAMQELLAAIPKVDLQAARERLVEKLRQQSRSLA